MQLVVMFAKVVVSSDPRREKIEEERRSAWGLADGR